MTVCVVFHLLWLFMQVIASTYENGYEKFKNGMTWSDEEAAERYHLRLLIGTGWFGDPKNRTMGHLHNDPAVQYAWDNYLYTQHVPSSMSRATWKRQIATARQWLANAPPSSEAKMLCEVQMVLSEYGRSRTAMHELYKIARAQNSAALHKEYSRYEKGFRIQQKYSQDGDTAFNYIILATQMRFPKFVEKKKEEEEERKRKRKWRRRQELTT